MAKEGTTIRGVVVVVVEETIAMVVITILVIILIPLTPLSFRVLVSPNHLLKVNTIRDLHAKFVGKMIM